jgi:hypothetical protein
MLRPPAPQNLQSRIEWRKAFTKFAILWKMGPVESRIRTDELPYTRDKELWLEICERKRQHRPHHRCFALLASFVPLFSVRPGACFRDRSNELKP